MSVHLDEESETEEVPRADGGEEEDEEWVEGEDLLARLQRIQARKGLLCEPDNPEKECQFSWLPYEVVLLILRWVVSAELDAASLERLAAACRGLYVACRDPDIWRAMCIRTWGAECGLPYALGVPGWRAMFVARPRLLLHGCYISKTTYLRCGENSFQDQTYRPWFLVDYYRYLRFFSDGVVLMCTTPDEPVACVPQLKSRHRLAAGALAGHYRLQGDQVCVRRRTSQWRACRNSRAGTGWRPARSPDTTGCKGTRYVYDAGRASGVRAATQEPAPAGGRRARRTLPAARGPGMCTTPDEPVACVPQLKSRHRLAAGALAGHYRLQGDQVCVRRRTSQWRACRNSRAGTGWRPARSPDTTGCKGTRYVYDAGRASGVRAATQEPAPAGGRRARRTLPAARGPGMCTTPDEPVACVPQLKSRHRLAAGALAGHYRLQGDQVLIIVKKSNEKKPAQPTHTRFRSRRKETHESHETIFRLELQIRAVRGRGNWQLAWRGYSVSTRRDQWTQFELSPAKFPPFAFSRVRGYTAHAAAPLE
ncbi:uncharacterized protein [Choristoneura fumiferana]|uniref:uncharacterized protein n=1 Tax=Choristoneura fumiferana TaxID=7141 RepID=UPI003D15A994